MMRSMLAPALLAALLIILPAAPVTAAPLSLPEQETQGPRVTVNLVGESAPAAEKADADLYETALGDFSTRGFAALTPHLAGLREALTRAPAAYPVMSETEGRWLIRTDSRDEAMILADVIGQVVQQRGGGDVKVVVRPNTYPRIAMILGSEAIERRAFEEAHRHLDAGLALQPLDRLLLNEKMVVLHAQARWDEAYELLKTALTAGDPLLQANPALLQRRLGYTLVELGRLNEARAAYEASLEAEPGNATALAELQFIADAEAGNPSYGEIQITAPLAPRPETTDAETQP